MNNTDTKLEIRTLGHFSISIDGKQVAKEWPNETLKVIFCSLLSPFDTYLTWNRICLNMWDIPDSRIVRNRLEELFIVPLNNYLIRELGFNPLISGDEGVSLDQMCIQLDALDFYSSFVEGKRLQANGNFSAATAMFRKADDIYVGSFLPGVKGKIIGNARNHLELLYRTAVKEIIPQLRNAGFSDCNSWPEAGVFLIAA